VKKERSSEKKDPKKKKGGLKGQEEQVVQGPKGTGPNPKRNGWATIIRVLKKKRVGLVQQNYRWDWEGRRQGCKKTGGKRGGSKSLLCFFFVGWCGVCGVLGGGENGVEFWGPREGKQKIPRVKSNREKKLTKKME